MPTTRDELHTMLDRLPDELLGAAASALDAVLLASDPLLRALESAPPEDEEITPEEWEALREGVEAAERGELVSHEDLLREVAEWEAEEARQ